MTIQFDPMNTTQHIGETFTAFFNNFNKVALLVDNLSSNVSALTGSLVNMDAVFPRITHFPPVSATAGQVNFTLPEPYDTGSLEVRSGGLSMIKDVNWQEVDPAAGTIKFLQPRVAGEVVEVTRLQVGSEFNGGTPVPGISVYLTTEVPTGAIDSTNGSDGNGVFTLKNAIVDNSIPKVIIEHSIQLTPNTEYTWSGNTITILAPHKPVVGETIAIEYMWRVA